MPSIIISTVLERVQHFSCIFLDSNAVKNTLVSQVLIACRLLARVEHWQDYWQE